MSAQSSSSDEQSQHMEETNAKSPEQEDSSSSMSSTSDSDQDQEVSKNVQQEGGFQQTEDKEHENVNMEDHQRTESNQIEDDGIYITKDDAIEANHSEFEEKTDDEENGDERKLDDHVLSDEAAQVMERMDVSDDDEDEVDAGPKKIDLEIARCKPRLGDEGPYFVKLPNFLSIDTKPFDPETYDDELEEDEVLDDEGKSRLKLKMENTIRWRIVKDENGSEKKESNARIVRWSDGSMSLYLGNEIFEVEKQKIMDFNHLYIRQGAALQAQSVFSEKLIFRPHSTETLTHRKMTLNMAEKTSKAQKVRMLAVVGDNPDEKKKELIRLEEEKLRAAARREAQQRRVRERPRAVGLTPGFLEGYESDEGAESLAAIKRRYQHAPYGVGERERSYSESEDEREEIQRKTIAEAKIDSEDEEMETSDTEQRNRQAQQQKKKIVIEEDEDE